MVVGTIYVPPPKQIFLQVSNWTIWGLNIFPGVTSYKIKLIFKTFPAAIKLSIVKVRFTDLRIQKVSETNTHFSLRSTLKARKYKNGLFNLKRFIFLDGHKMHFQGKT